MDDERQRVRILVGDRELPQEDIQSRVVAALAIGAVLVLAMLALPWIGGW